MKNTRSLLRLCVVLTFLSHTFMLLAKQVPHLSQKDSIAAVQRYKLKPKIADLKELMDTIPLFEIQLIQHFQNKIRNLDDSIQVKYYQSLAIDLVQMNKIKLAVQAFDKGLTLIPDGNNKALALHHYNKALYLFNDLYKSEIIDLCNLALAEKPKKGSRLEALIYRERGRASYEDGDYAKAMADYMVAKAYFDINKVEDSEFGALLHYIGSTFKRQNHEEEALKYYIREVELGREIKDKMVEADGLYLCADIYNSMDSVEKDLEYSLKALDIYNEIKMYSMQEVMLMNIAHHYVTHKNYPLAKMYLDSCLATNTRYPSSHSKSTIWRLYAKYYSKKGAYKKAIDYIDLALEEAENSKSIRLMLLGDVYRTEAWIHYDHKQYKYAFESLDDYQYYWEKLINEQNSRIIHDMDAKYQNDKKEKEIELLNKAKAFNALALKNSRQRNFFLVIGFVVAILFMLFTLNRYQYIRKQKKVIEVEKQRSEELLLNILPEEVAEELKTKGSADAQLIDMVTVLFTDFKGFTAISETMSPNELVADLHENFSAFDQIMEKHGIEKIKTIGDAYMAAGGLPTANQSHPFDVVHAALEIRDFVDQIKVKKMKAGLPYFEIRVGVHTGPVVAGIVGVKKFSYDIWGDTVNTSSRMESSGSVGKVNISQVTYELVKDSSEFSFESRGKIAAKGKGDLEMHFVERV